MSWFLGDTGNTSPHSHCSRQMIAGPASSSCVSTERLLRKLYSERQDVHVKKRGSPVKEDLRVAKYGHELDYKAERVHTFNKINFGRDSPLTWGEDGQFERVKCVHSLRAWLDSPLAVEYELDRSYEDDFQVFQNGGILRTLNGDFKGGVGVFTLWIPSRKHDKLASNHWASLWHMENDPRTQYTDPVTGKAWVAK